MIARLKASTQPFTSSLRRWSKARVAGALCAVGGDRLIGHLTGATRAPLVVGYHRVVEHLSLLETPTVTPMAVSVQMFEQQLDWLARRYQVVSLDELAAQLEDGRPPAKPVAAVTFDDGYAELFEHATPVLMRKGIPAAAFLVTNWVGSTSMLDHDRLYRLLAIGWPRSLDIVARHGSPERCPFPSRGPFALLRHLLVSRSRAQLLSLCADLEEVLNVHEKTPRTLRPLTWEMVATMYRAGITIGSHTENHSRLTCESAETVQAEVGNSREILRKRLGGDVRYFAYPGGAYDAGVVKSVAQAGYRLAFTTCHHRDDVHPCLTVPRHLLWENSCIDLNGQFSPPILACLTSRVFDLRSECRAPHTGDPATASAR